MTKRQILLTLLDEFSSIERGDMTDSSKLAIQFGIDIAANVLVRSHRLAMVWRAACKVVMRNRGHVGQTAIDIILDG